MQYGLLDVAYQQPGNQLPLFHMFSLLILDMKSIHLPGKVQDLQFKQMWWTGGLVGFLESFSSPPFGSANAWTSEVLFCHNRFVPFLPYVFFIFLVFWGGASLKQVLLDGAESVFLFHPHLQPWVKCLCFLCLDNFSCICLQPPSCQCFAHPESQWVKDRFAVVLLLDRQTFIFPFIFLHPRTRTFIFSSVLLHPICFSSQNRCQQFQIIFQMEPFELCVLKGPPSLFLIAPFPLQPQLESASSQSLHNL